MDGVERTRRKQIQREKEREKRDVRKRQHVARHYASKTEKKLREREPYQREWQGIGRKFQQQDRRE